MLISTILLAIGQEHTVGQVLDSGANCNLAFLTTSTTTALKKWTLEFLTVVIKSLLTITSPSTPLHYALQGARGKILKPTKIR